MFVYTLLPAAGMALLSAIVGSCTLREWGFFALFLGGLAFWALSAFSVCRYVLGDRPLLRESVVVLFAIYAGTLLAVPVLLYAYGAHPALGLGGWLLYTAGVLYLTRRRLTVPSFLAVWFTAVGLSQVSAPQLAREFQTPPSLNAVSLAVAVVLTPVCLALVRVLLTPYLQEPEEAPLS